MFLIDVLSSLKRISKGMANNYLKVTNEKSWRSQNFDFLSLKNSSPDQFFESSNSRSVIEFLNLFL